MKHLAEAVYKGTPATGEDTACRVVELEEQLVRARSEAAKAQELSDIAVSQLSAIAHARAVTAEEVEALREQVPCTDSHCFLS